MPSPTVRAPTHARLPLHPHPPRPCAGQHSHGLSTPRRLLQQQVGAASTQAGPQAGTPQAVQVTAPLWVAVSLFANVTRVTAPFTRVASGLGVTSVSALGTLVQAGGSGGGRR